MKLVNKRNVFLSSADMASGDKGQFTIQLPYDMVFDEKMVFKIWISQLNMRNTFFYVERRNCAFFAAIVRAGSPQPRSPTAVDDGDYVRCNIPYGFPSDVGVAQAVNELLYHIDEVHDSNNELTLCCRHRFGRLYFVQIGTATNPAPQRDYDLWLYFQSQQPGSDIGPCNSAMGFPQQDHAYLVEVDINNYDAYDYRYNADMATNLPYEAALSPVLMDIDHISDVIIKTSLPADNYSVDSQGPAVTGITLQVPLLVPPGGQIYYADERGVNAMYEKSRSVVNTLDVQVLDKTLHQLMPQHDWSFVLAVEQYEDTETQVLQSLSKQLSNDDEIIQLAKMTLLQAEFRRK